MYELTNGEIVIHTIDLKTAKEYVKNNPSYKIVEKEKPKPKTWKDALNELIVFICINCKDHDDCNNCVVKENKKVIIGKIEGGKN